MEPLKVYEATDTLIASMDGDGERAGYFEHLRGLYPQELGAAAVSGATEASEALAEEDGPAFELIDIRTDEEKAAEVTQVTTALAEKFKVPTENFSVLRVQAEDGSEQTVVAYTAPNGIDLGSARKDYDEKRSWNSIFSKRNAKKFMVEVNGQTYDSRSGMTWQAYQAFIEDARAKGTKDPLPDSPQLSEQNGEVWTDTWLTGEEAGSGGARVAYVSGGGDVSRGWRHRGHGDRDHRFRPAVVV